MRLVEIVDAPNEAPFGITPRAEVRHMQVADRKQRRGVRKCRAEFGKSLRPAVECRPEKWKRPGHHLLMLEVQVGLNKRRPLPKPLFITFRRCLDVHKLGLNERKGMHGTEVLRDERRRLMSTCVDKE